MIKNNEIQVSIISSLYLSLQIYMSSTQQIVPEHNSYSPLYIEKVEHK